MIGGKRGGEVLEGVFGKVGRSVYPLPTHHHPLPNPLPPTYKPPPHNPTYNRTALIINSGSTVIGGSSFSPLESHYF